MKHIRLAALAFLVSATLAMAAPAADDTVTIPKSKLQELERKAAELEKLKKELNKSEVEKEQIKKEKEEAETEKRQLQKAKEDAETKAAKALAAPPAPARVSPPMASLPLLKEGEVVDSVDLLNHYLAEPAAAAQRYGKEHLLVRGEIVGFSKPMFVRPYKILLKTGDPVKRVVCTLYPTDQYRAVYPSKNGTVLVGLTAREAEVPLFKVGQTVVIEGTCKGANDEGVHLGSCSLKSVQ